ncbi:MAG: AAA family ATPase [Lachnospiraceae bacterium]|nr:AAA family ATPase [Lachnospiraceae bacterium]
MEFSDKVNEIINSAFIKAGLEENEYMTPEHLLYAFCKEVCFQKALLCCGGNAAHLERNLNQFFRSQLPDKGGDEIAVSNGTQQVFEYAVHQAIASGRDAVEISHILKGIMEQEESFAVYYLSKEIENPAALLAALNEEMSKMFSEASQRNLTEDSDEMDGLWTSASEPDGKWKNFVVCLNDTVADHNPLVGREEELERTIQVLCCRDKNNPLHIGEAGVGKTSITYGLAARINEGDVPESLKKAKIFMLDMAGMVAGTQYRGEYEKRVRDVMANIAKEDSPIVFIDEIHTIVGAGDQSGSMDAASLLKPWFENPSIRFIGSTTYEEYNRSISKNKSLIRRFQNIDILEPSQSECISILEGIRERYEVHHGVVYADGFMEKAVELSARYMNERFLPDKAIGLMDEAGAWLQLHPEQAKEKTADGRLIADTDLVDLTVSRICRIPQTVLSQEDETGLLTLKDRITAQVFGQDEAIERAVYAVQISRLGLVDEHKPVASLLFVGPTGVGKTEAAKVLAEQLGISFVRFDMSEYTERHTVAKLIGSPAGYVGFEDGGQLTDAIRKNPHCVLLLDEIEKAHSDIFNILLQVMDYATLTDNHGRKADFSHVILIMTSNAGAASVGQKMIGFGDRAVMESNMLDEVKRTFSPEFRNRLSGTLMFHKLSPDMAMRIVKKKTAHLTGYLKKRGISVFYSEEVYEYLLQKGYSQEYGAREIDRVIQEKLKPLFVKEILNGSLKNGGHVSVIMDPERKDRISLVSED